MTDAIKPILAYSDAWERLMPVEGGFVSNPRDPGKRTIYGIAEASNPDLWANGVPSYAQCRERGKRYWDAVNGDVIVKYSGQVAYKLFDTQFNAGQGAIFLQRALNVMNRLQQDYADLKVDGNIGATTMAAFQRFWACWGNRAEQLMMKCLNILQGSYYLSLAEHNQSFEEFFDGWLLNRIDFFSQG